MLIARVLALILGVAVLGVCAEGKRPNSILVYAYEFDRGNVKVEDTGTGYADAEPVIYNGGQQPNTTEYDLDFPVAATYTIAARYAAADSRPVDLYLDGVKLHRGFASTTGSWLTSTAKWEEQCRVEIGQGKHTLKLVCPGPCMPHIVALRLESPVPFPAGWKRKRRPIEDRLNMSWSGKPEPGKYGYEAYVRADGFVDAPADYNPIVPFRRIPAPNPRAHRILEYLLMGEGRYRVDARIEPADEDDTTGGWVARLSVKVDAGRMDTDVLPLSTEYVRKMLQHALRLLADHRAVGTSRNHPTTQPPNHLAALARQLLGELREAEGRPEGRAKWQRVYDLHVQAYRLKHRVALSNPLLDFRRLLFAKRQTYDTSHIYTTYFDGSHRYGGNLCTLSPVRPDGVATPLVKGLSSSAIFRDPDLSWDARRVLFSYKPDLQTPCRIYEVGIDGSGLRQITKSEYDDVDPCYLPDGRILFVSTRCRRVVLCHNAFTVSVLHSMNADGSGVRCLSPNTVNDFTPSMAADGQVLYTRWEYVDKQLGNNQSLWAVNPDGTSPSHLAGAHWGPITFWEPRQIPGSHRVVCTLAPHMPIAVGPIAVVDPADRCSSPAHFHNLTPELPPPHHFGWHRTDVGYYCNAFPLSESYFLVSYSYGPEDRAPAGYGLYLLDKWNNRDLIYRDPAISCFEAFPVTPRRRPPAFPPVARPKRDTGAFHVLDVYRGLEGIARGSVKYLRILEDIPKPVSANCGGYGLQYPLLSNYGNLALKRVWGTVPVERDGSAHFEAPADKAIWFSALDGSFREVQRMRAFTVVAPGQTVSCIGCHEHRDTSPPNRATLALRRGPSEITPPPGGVHAPDFYRDVQPVLDRHCPGCHGGARRDGGVDLSPDFTNLFNVAYETLTAGGYVSYANTLNSDTLPLRPPKFYGSHASKLVTALLTTHRERVRLSPEELHRIALWVDTNAPYYGTYLYSRPGTIGGRELITPGFRAALDGVFARRCASCHGEERVRIERIRFAQVERSPALLAPLSREIGGTEACGKAVFGGRDDPDLKALVDALKGIEAEIRSNPREDMLARRPPLLDESCYYCLR